MNPYETCPLSKTESFTVRLINEKDSISLFQCYHDHTSVQLMNDDNCDFGFYVETPEKMSETIGYWLDFYKQQSFIRFAVVDNRTGEAVGTVEGFGGETGVLRLDISSDYEKSSYISELLNYAKNNFYDYFGNEYLVTKAIPEAAERRQALLNNGWEYIGLFREYKDYYRIKTNSQKKI